MPNLTEGPHPAEFLLSEAPGYYSRENGTVTVAANTTLPAGTVLQAASTKWVVLDDSTNAAAILYSELTNDTAAPVDFKAAIIVRNAEIRTLSLVWPTGWVAANYAASLTALKALGLIARS